MTDVFEAAAIMPRVGMALRQGDKAFLLYPDGRLVPKFPLFPEAAVSKYGYRELKPLAGSLEDMKKLFAFLSQRDEE